MPSIFTKLSKAMGMTMGSLSRIGKSLSLIILLSLTMMGVAMIFVDWGQYATMEGERTIMLEAAARATTGEAASAIINSYMDRTTKLGAVIRLVEAILPMWLVLSGFVGLAGLLSNSKWSVSNIVDVAKNMGQQVFGGGGGNPAVPTPITSNPVVPQVAGQSGDMGLYVGNTGKPAKSPADNLRSM